MDNAIANSTKAILGAKAVKGFRFSWLVYGAVAYFGIKYLYKKGILPNQTGAALDLMDKGVDYAKKQIGLGSDEKEPSFNKVSSQSEASVHH